MWIWLINQVRQGRDLLVERLVVLVLVGVFQFDVAFRCRLEAVKGEHSAVAVGHEAVVWGCLLDVVVVAVIIMTVVVVMAVIIVMVMAVVIVTVIVVAASHSSQLHRCEAEQGCAGPCCEHHFNYYL